MFLPHHSRLGVLMKGFRRSLCARVGPPGLVLAWLVVTLAAVPPASAGAQQSGLVVGTVTDRATSQPLDAGTVTIVGTKLGAATDGRGHFIIRGVAAGAATVRVQRIGYRPATQSVRVSANDSVSVQFALEVSAVELNQVV